MASKKSRARKQARPAAPVEMNYEELIAECKRLRREAERAEATFLAFLMKCEKSYEEVWRGAGCETFDQFIRSNDLCKPDRYLLFAVGVGRVGLQAALANGAHWTIQAGRMRDPSDEILEAFQERATDFVSVHGVAPSNETAREWAAELQPARENTAGQARASELRRLRAENARLRAELKAANARIEELEGKAA